MWHGGNIESSKTSPPKLKVVKQIESILRFASEEYAAEVDPVCANVRGLYLEKSINHFLKLVRQPDAIRTPKMLYLTNYTLWLFRRVMKRLIRPRETVHPAFEPRKAPVRA